MSALWPSSDWLFHWLEALPNLPRGEETTPNSSNAYPRNPSKPLAPSTAQGLMN